VRYGKLGNSGLVVSRLGFGAGSLGVGETLPGLVKNIDQEAANAVVGKAIDAGITMFDTSNKYVNGQSEAFLGKALASRRNEVVLATKCGLPVGPSTLDRGLSARSVILECERSLKRLGTDWIDLYYAHQIDPDTPLEETARAFESLVTSGKVRYVAVSNWPAWMTARMQAIGDKMGYSPIVANQVYYSLLGRQVERELVPLAKASGMGLVIYSALAGGFLSGKYERGKDAPEGSRRATFNMSPRFEIEHGHDVVDLLRELAKGYGVPPAHVALAWTMQRPTVASVLFGISRPAQLDENLPAADLVLDQVHIDALDAITEPAE
jgi:aryl-alcohol dehydrogenase-like predicted oxidoreductase